MKNIVIKKISAPFTLIELLVVIAIIGGKVPLPDNGMFVASLLLMPLGACRPAATVRSSRFGHLFSKGENVKLRAMIQANDAALDAPVKLSILDGYGNNVFEQERAFTLPAGNADEFAVEIPAEKFTAFGLYTARLTVGGKFPTQADSTFGILPPYEAGMDENADSFDSPFGAFLYPLNGKLYPEYGPDYNLNSAVM